LHVGDKGGNQTQVRFFDRGTNMYSLWDTGIIEWFSRGEDEWLGELTVLASPQSPDSTSEGTVEDWGEGFVDGQNGLPRPDDGQP
jgi:hypothetical protein